MLYDNNISIYLLCLIFVLSYGVESFVPTERIGHSSVLVGNKLYFFGGETPNIYSNEVFYLDLSQPFNLLGAQPWVDLTSKSAIPFGSAWASVALGNTNNEQIIYLFGGYMVDINTQNDSFTTFTHRFNVGSSLKWDAPFVGGKLPDRRTDMHAIGDNTGKFFILNGYTDELLGTEPGFLRDMSIFDSVNLLWSSSPLNVPTPRISYSATLLSNGVIVYIGGYDELQINVEISKIHVYDTKTLVWSEKTAQFKNQMENRSGHTAVLAPNGKIIIFGGVNDNNFQLKSDTITAVLNTEVEPFEWSTPFVASNINKYPSLLFHTANLFENYMIVAFGQDTQPNADPTGPSRNIYFMDIRNFTWVNSFDLDNLTNTSIPAEQPSSSTSSTSTSLHSNNSQLNNNGHGPNNNNIIIITAIVVVGAVVIVSAFLIYRYRTAAISRGNPNPESSDCNVLVVER